MKAAEGPKKEQKAVGGSQESNLRLVPAAVE